MRIVSIDQVNDFSEIWLTLVVTAEQLSGLSTEKELLEYGIILSQLVEAFIFASDSPMSLDRLCVLSLSSLRLR